MAQENANNNTSNNDNNNSSAAAATATTPAEGSATTSQRPSQVRPPRRRRPRKAAAATTTVSPPESAAANASTTEAPSAASTTSVQGGDTSNNNNNNNLKKKKHRKRNKKTQSENKDESVKQQENNDIKEEGEEQGDNSKKNAKNRNNNKSRNRNRNRNRSKSAAAAAPWKKHLPEEAVDPITLEPLEDLQYPPFALAANQPYDPVSEWPVPDPPVAESNEQNEKDKEISRQKLEEERQRRILEEHRRILEEQWGQQLSLLESKKKTGEEKEDSKPSSTTEEAAAPPAKRYYNLYDGRALAYYMVSTSDYIDPLNRRDLTRDELVNLDAYLQRHGFFDLNVTEAYDNYGLTVSKAGAAAHTADGRAERMQQRMQQIASHLLDALYSGTSVASVTTAANAAATTTAGRGNNNPLMQQYQAHEASQQRQHQQQRRQRQQQRHPQQGQEYGPHTTTGVYGDFDSGLMIIDDDENPGLRGAAPEFVPSNSLRPSQIPNSLYSARHIASAHAARGNPAEMEFPALGAAPADSGATAEATPTTTPSSSTQSKAKKPLPTYKTLSKIAKAVKKTTPEEQQRQWEAREEARRKALLTNLTFGSNPASWNHQPQLLQPPSSLAPAPTEGQLERNQRFADALGLQTAKVRQQLNSGWSRPVHESAQGVDAYGNLIPETVYPDALILAARDRMGVLLKLERKWKSFLADDKAASLPLNPMDRDTRAFVHEYSDYWKLNTESFDPEPKRYIHCVKLLDTAAPFPLLSDVAQRWRGPTQRPTTFEHPVHQTAGQTSQEGEFAAIGNLKPPPPSVSAGTEEASRFASLAPEARERPRLELQPRTAPLELPPFDPGTNSSKGFDAAEGIRRQKLRAEEMQKKQQQEQAKRERLLAAAFASDDEDENEGGRVAGDDDSSDWEETSALYTGSDEEDDEA